MRKAINKDFFREIKYTFSRYISIVLIVALGVAFFSGIRATCPDMKLTLDYYLDATNFMDIRVLSTMGLTDDDIEAIAAIEGVAAVDAAYTYDAYAIHDGEKRTLHFISLPDGVNVPDLVDGRWIEEDDECLVDSYLISKYGYSVGDTITVISAYDDEEVSDTLSVETYTIVGVVTSSSYFTTTRDTTSIGTGQTDAFVYLSKEVFLTEVYTAAYILVDEAIVKTAYSDEYDELVEAVTERLEAISAKREAARYDGIMADANEEIADAKQEIEDAKTELYEELADAWQQIEDGQQEIADGYQELADGKAEYNTQIADAKKQLISAANELADGEKTIAENEETLAAAKAQLVAGQEELDAYAAELSQGLEEYESGLAEATAGQQQLTQAYEQLLAALEEIEAQEAALTTQRSELSAQQSQLEAQLTQLIAMGIESQELTEALESISAGIAQIDAALLQIAEGKVTIEAQLAMLDEQQASLDEAFAQLEAAYEEITAGEAQIAAAQAELDAAEAEIAEGEAAIASAKAEISSGYAQIKEGWAELYAQMAEAEAEFADAEEQLADGEAEIADAIEEYYTAKEDAEVEIADAEAEIADAEAELADISYPEWYVLDRNSTQGYVEYGQNADRINAIGKVFPVIFFLVAALMSLTTMTRMVESQRTQIGTLKALGYSSWSIARKYVFYALSASMIGSVIGVVLGQKALPWIVINAYGVMYPNIPVILNPLNAYYAIIAAGAAIICVTGAALLSCYKELLSSPASLMRPEAPKVGKKIWLEYIGFIWRRLNFTSKVAMRNLFRYKKRFFMTVFGISGCTALVLFSFGLTDSITGVEDKQFDELFLYDITLTIDDDADDEDMDELIAYMDSTEDMDITGHMRVRSMSIELGEGKAAYTAYLTVPEDVEGYTEFVTFRDRVSGESYELTDDAVIITEKIADLLELSVGDEITIEDNDTKVSVTVGAIAENYLMSYVYMSPVLYEELFGQAPEWNVIQTTIADITEDNEDEFAQLLLEKDAISGVTTSKSSRENFATVLNSLGIVTFVLLISAGLLAFIVLYNLNNINITERRRELATIRVLGFYDMELAMYVYRENIMLTLIGALVGLIFGKYLHSFIITTVETEIIMFVRHAQPISYVYAVLITFVFSLIVNGIMYFRLRKIDMVESLKSVE